MYDISLVCVISIMRARGLSSRVTLWRKRGQFRIHCELSARMKTLKTHQSPGLRVALPRCHGRGMDEVSNEENNMNQENKFKCAKCGKDTRTSKYNFEAFCFDCARDLGVPEGIRRDPGRFYAVMEGEVRARRSMSNPLDLAPPELARVLLEYGVLEEEVPPGLCRAVGHKEVPIEQGNARCSRCGAVKWECSPGGYSETRETIGVVLPSRRISRSW